jgi:molybdate transport system substrate-binding protein
MICQIKAEGILKGKTLRRSIILAATLAVTLGFASLMARKVPAQGAELRVFASDGVKPAVEALIPQIEHVIGRKIAPEFDASKTLRDKILSGASFDVAIVTSDVVDELIKQGKVAAGTRTEVASAGMGIGIRAGAHKPDFSTPEAMKRTLVKAKSITFNPSGASAAHINDMFERLGITGEMKPKLLLDPVAGAPQKYVAEGKAELVITLIPEIEFFPGMQLAGPLPGDFQSYIGFSAGIAANSHDADAAKALIKFITSPSAAATMKSKGLEPR